MVSLQDILSNKQRKWGFLAGVSARHCHRRPAFLSSYWTLSNGRRADCLLKLPSAGRLWLFQSFPESCKLSSSKTRQRGCRPPGFCRCLAHMLKPSQVCLTGKRRPAYVLPSERFTLSYATFTTWSGLISASCMDRLANDTDGNLEYDPRRPKGCQNARTGRRYPG